MILVCDIVSRSLICCFANNENGLLPTKRRYVLAGALRRLGFGGGVYPKDCVNLQTDVR